MTLTDKRAPKSPVDFQEDRLVALGIELGRLQKISTQKLEEFPLLAQLELQEESLRAAHQRIQKSTDAKLTQSQAAEWLLDNFYVVEEAFQQIREDFPKNYYQKLPILETSEFASHPRVFGIAWTFIQQVGFNPNYDQITRFISAYQQETALSIGEIWAIPTMLRIVILENLAHIIASTAGLAYTPLNFSMSQLAEEHDRRMLVGSCIQGLRSLKNTSWKQYFEAVSVVEITLNEDPVGIYPQMDFNTRDQYRNAVEALALESRWTEDQIASLAIQMAQEAYDTQSDPSEPANQVRAHVGYYLVERGRLDLEARITYHPDWRNRITRWAGRHAFPLYIGNILVFTSLLVIILLVYLMSINAGLLKIFAIGFLSILPASAIAVSLTNRLVTHLAPPRPPLARLDFSQGVPQTCRTLVAIPALLTNSESVNSLLRQIELYYLGNEDDQIFFALLTDFPDGDQPTMPEDAALLEQVSDGIKELNARYKRPSGNWFFLFHRDRKWNPSENAWMGWERKRGKLMELNHFLRNRQSNTFSRIVGKVSLLKGIRYVITMDEDTFFPNNTARELIGTMAHPFNRPQFDPSSGKVVAGYTLLQPRVEVKPGSAWRTWFTRFYASGEGINLYSQVVSNVYQDLFAEGSYMGKGIYDLDAFTRSLEGLIPENAVLSHDLLEGLHGRAGLVSDIVLYEGFPPFYLAYAQRIHRWVRGDWQLLPWLLPFLNRLPVEAGRKRLTPLGIWKIFDNLRRSLTFPGTLAFLTTGWFWFPGPMLVWTLVALLPLAVPVFTTMIPGFLRGLNAGSLTKIWQSTRFDLLRWFLSIAFLPYQTLLIIDAIATTLVRLTITRKRLLQWTTASHTIRVLSNEYKVQVTWNRMRVVILFDVVLALLVGFYIPERLLAVAPILLVWFVSPQIAHRISQPIVRKNAVVTPEQRQELRSLARRTWLFFEQFVGPEDHWLPPDHYQEEPRGTVAHRTSPTNIGLGLLSMIAAYDLGYIGLSDLSIRLQNTFNELCSMEKYSGHLLNWYETHFLKPLTPRYVSTVDSGNFAGCLLALQQGCRQVIQLNVFQPQRWQGIVDSFALLEDTLVLAHLEPQGETLSEIIKQILQEIEAVKGKPERWFEALKSISEHHWIELNQQIRQLISESSSEMEYETLRALRVWSERVHQQFLSMLRTMDTLLPWLAAFDRHPPFFDTLDDPSTQELWQSLVGLFPVSANLETIIGLCAEGLDRLAKLQDKLSTHQSTEANIEAEEWCKEFAEKLVSTGQKANSLLESYQSLIEKAETLFQEMDFSFLYNENRHIFRLGYNVDTGRLDENHYDLLASEARLASLVAIAKGDVPQKHWLHLSRPLTRTNQGHALISWSGSMFEYLMPHLLMRQYPNTLLDLACTTVVEKQIDYCSKKGVPWGISESGYYHFDANMNYQYRAFGVPGLGFKRGLDADLVVTPYATLLSLPVNPAGVVENVSRLTSMGLLSLYGFYEAIDFTSSRLPLAKDHAPVLSYMAHHQGMILLSLVNFLEENTMIRRFHADPRIEAFEMLLQEQIPAQPRFQVIEEKEITRLQRAPSRLAVESWTPKTNLGFPAVHFLSNGRFGSLITSNGGGFLQFMPAKYRGEPVMLTRWKADTTLDQWGTWIYIQDVQSGNYWSASHQPIGIEPETQKIEYYPHQVEFIRRDRDISTQTLITVSPDENVEIRKVVLINHFGEKRRLSVTSYGEVALSEQNVDNRHPAFNKLFIESEFIPDLSAILFKRRPRSSDEDITYLVHMLVAKNPQEEPPRFEGDRTKFIGRGKTAQNPGVLDEPGTRLSNTSGTTLDPIMALSCQVELAPRETCELAFLTFVAGSRQKALQMANHYQLWPRIERTFDRAASTNSQELNKLELSIGQLALMQQLLSLLFYPHAALRIDPGILILNEKGQSGLWSNAISGDYPILLVRAQKPEDSVLISSLLAGHRYWRKQGLKIDLVILNESEISYDQDLQEQIYQLITKFESSLWINQRGGIFILHAALMNQKDIFLLETAARVVLNASDGSLAEQVKSIASAPTFLPHLNPMADPLSPQQSVKFMERPGNLQFDNGYGGFSPDGKEYVIYLEPGQWTPSPWINVIANPNFGSIVSEAAMGCTWAGNSSENRLTPWRNDPLSDHPAEAIYLRNEETGQIWSPTPLPARANAPYRIRHGMGYSIYEHNSYGFEQSLRIFIDPDDAVKFATLTLKNNLDRVQQITVTYYAEWVLGPDQSRMAPFIVPEFEPQGNALLARNEYNQEFKGRIAFLAASREIHGFTTDRFEFLGQNGSYTSPAALRRLGLSGIVKPGTDPCAALQALLWLEPGETKEITFMLGQGKDYTETLQWIQKYKKIEAITESWLRAAERWTAILNRIEIQTPDPAMDLMLNQWLLYQTVSCRLWGRSALYQSGGAFGFRDQLQDVMALTQTTPQLTRSHILQAAQHQFEEGDVLHWWHPPSGRGIRSRCSDNLLWLPYVTVHYINTTGDESILEENIPFLSGKPLEDGELDRYDFYKSGEVTGTLLEHCRRAIAFGTTEGMHGLPLIGSHDWNDSLNRVGIKGKGESIWLGWFLYANLMDFSALCERIGDSAQAEAYQRQAEKFRQALDQHAWDGAWYRRAYWDDGTPIGSAENVECRIDSIAQSWAVLSNAADPQRARQAMQSIEENLVKWDEALVQLFTPPFDKSPLDPGYVKGYPPGIRENGGQYTHAALWAVWAFASLGQAELAGRLFKMLNPISHSDQYEKANRYQVEPYVVAADIYSVEPHTGKGGWTWYTGSAGWMYRLGLEVILGIKRSGAQLQISPCIPPEWPGFAVKYRYGETLYQVQVHTSQQANRRADEIRLDGEKIPGNSIPLVDDRRTHQVEVYLGK